MSLEEKYTGRDGRILVSGTQALTRLALLQREIDAQAGLNSAGFISGYRGSPLGTLDLALWKAKEHLDAAQVTFLPGVNEELAATAVWGTQQLNSVPGAKVDGVFGMWYGKGPGVDRCGDVFKHANHQGTHPNGGVLVVCGDDHPGKSSTVAHQSEQALTASLIPCLYPASVQEYIEYGLKGWALSRYSGLWVGFKCVNETVEQTATVDVRPYQIFRPDRSDLPDEARGKTGWLTAIEKEIAVRRVRLPLVHRFVRANRLDVQTLGGDDARFGIVSAGKSYADVMQALQLLDIDADRAIELGIAVYKVGCIWPLEPEGLKQFAIGRTELFFVEEKAAFVEAQAAEVLYNTSARPAIVGKRDPLGQFLLPQDVQLDPITIAHVIASRLEALSLADDELRHRATNLTRPSLDKMTSVSRAPYFCSGCPHNSSTKVPEGSYAMAGIGCHGMAVLTRADTMYPGQMGGEGANWIGLSRYTSTPHIFQNLGDGTYYHSGYLAIRAAVAAKVNITYKILYNAAVAMTGGQPVDGPISVAQITNQVMHEGVSKCIVVTDNPDAYRGGRGLAAGVTVRHRDELELVQRQLRDTPGCTVLVYEQTCAAEMRRLRKRDKAPDPPKRMFINDAVCEGCGDCSTQSSCMSVQPLATREGIKRRIDQSSCNKDYSCVKGFCPSFVTVLGATPRKPRNANLDVLLASSLPTPRFDPTKPYSVMIAGIGGTGVITVGAILAMAVHIEGRSCSAYDMTGLAQKNGAVYSHLKIADSNADLAAQRIGAGEADLVLAFDLVAALSGDAAPTYAPGRTHIVADAHVSPTVAFQLNPDARLPIAQMQSQLIDLVGAQNCHFADATSIALTCFGDTIAANLFLTGFAIQQGLLPIGVEAAERAIELNGAAITLNKKALKLGRLWAHEPQAVRKALGLQNQNGQEDETLEATVAERAAFLTAYQNDAYASRYRKLVERVRSAELSVSASRDELSRAVAKYFAKLLAYKDEYEIARLFTAEAFKGKLTSEFEPGFKLRFNLAPPLIARRDPQTGHLKKMEFGPWILALFGALAPLKVLRGTPFDIFGYTSERKMERQLIADYERTIDKLLGKLSSSNYEIAVEIATLPEFIRGFGHVKKTNAERIEQRRALLLSSFESDGSLSAAQMVGGR